MHAHAAPLRVESDEERRLDQGREPETSSIMIRLHAAPIHTHDEVQRRQEPQGRQAEEAG